MAEAFLELIGWILIDIIGHGFAVFFRGIGRLLRGKPFLLTDQDELEKKYLHRRVSVSLKFHDSIERATIGQIVEITDKKTALVQFQDNQGKAIQVDGQLKVSAPLSHLRIKRTKRKGSK